MYLVLYNKFYNCIKIYYESNNTNIVENEFSYKRLYNTSISSNSSNSSNLSNLSNSSNSSNSSTSSKSLSIPIYDLSQSLVFSPISLQSKSLPSSPITNKLSMSLQSKSLPSSPIEKYGIFLNYLAPSPSLSPQLLRSLPSILPISLSSKASSSKASSSKASSSKASSSN